MHWRHHDQEPRQFELPLQFLLDNTPMACSEK